MAFIALSLIVVFLLWFFAWMLIDSNLLGRMVSLGCLVLAMPILSASTLEYVTENAGTLATPTLALSATLRSTLVFLNLMFLLLDMEEFFKYTGRDRLGRKLF